MGYFLWLNDSIITTKVANVTANINASNTDIGTTPGPQDVGHADVAAGRGEFSLPFLSQTGVSRPPLSFLFYCPSILSYIRSLFSVIFQLLLD